MTNSSDINCGIPYITSIDYSIPFRDANCDLDPDLRLIRGDIIPSSFQIQGLIASPCRSESLAANIVLLVAVVMLCMMMAIILSLIMQIYHIWIIN